MSVQVVNLLEADLLPKREWMLFNQCLVVVAGWVVVLLCMSGYQAYRAFDLDSQSDALNERVTALSEIRAARERAVPLARLRESLGALQAQAQKNQRLLAELSNASTDGFAVYLLGLSEARVTGLWLDRFDVRHPPGGKPLIGIGGKTVGTHLVPQFLHALTAIDVFGGHHFTDLIIAADSETHDFSVTTKARPAS